MSKSCELCKFRNPKGSVTAAIIRDNKLLVLKRAEAPFKNKWDLPGGYMNENETAQMAVIREVREELGINPEEVTFILDLAGTGFWKKKKFPIISHFYLVDIGDYLIELNEENKEYKCIPLSEIVSSEIAWDSNILFVDYLKQQFTFDLQRVEELTKQLDSSAEIEEQSLYRAVINGKVARIEKDGLLIALGWIFPRQTMLRKQAVIEDMIVHEAYRGKGYGRLLLDILFQWAREQNIEVIELTSNPARIAANELYKKYGFQLHPTNHYLYKLWE